MKLNNIVFVILLSFVTVTTATAQENRTVRTKVADALAYLPASDNAQAERLFLELVTLNDEGYALITDQVQPNGVAAGVPYRYAVSLLTHYAETTEQKASIEKAWLSALGKASNTEVKSYFIDNLKWVGSDASVVTLTGLIKDKDLNDQAIAALEIIGTTAAKNALMSAATDAPAFAQARLLQALGALRINSSLGLITKKVDSGDPVVKRSALWALALLGDPSSGQLLYDQAKAVSFKNENASEAVVALIEYLHQVRSNGKVVSAISQNILDNANDQSQQHIRLAALEAYAHADHEKSTKLLVKERNKFDPEYRREVLKIAAGMPADASSTKIWEKEMKKASGDDQAEILKVLASGNATQTFTSATLIPFLKSPNVEVRAAAAQEIANRREKGSAGALVDYLVNATDEEREAAKRDVLQITDKGNTNLLTAKLPTATPNAKIAILAILAERRSLESFDAVLAQTQSADPAVKKAALAALPAVSDSGNVPVLIGKINSSSDADEIKAYQAALSGSADAKSFSSINSAFNANRIKLLPVLPYVGDDTALTTVNNVLTSGNEAEKDAAFVALTNWQNGDAVRTLIAIRKNPELKKYHSKVLAPALTQTTRSSMPDDEKLLMLKELMNLSGDKQEKIQVIRACGNVRTFLSLVFVAEYLDDAELGSVATRAAMQLSLPTADARPGMTGSFVRQTLEHVQEKLIGEDSQYERIDVATYLAKLPYTRGYEPIFNGKDLTGWQGLVENPILRAKMTQQVLAAKQKEADAKVSKNWTVKDGMIVFQGDGANLATIKSYGDFEMIVDWRISKNGDSGIYLRGSPQVQIWDVARTDVGAQVGSGGLYNNQKEQSKPLVVADNPVGEWNTFHIKMLGDKVTVKLNGVLVVDNVTLENYWDRNMPIFPAGSIELQAHGTDLAFRNIYVMDLGNAAVELSDTEKQEGFQSLFNGKDLSQWVGNTTDYVVEENAIALYPSKESHGNLSTSKEYGDFIFRFEFQLTPGANNGIGIHAPLEGDAAYLGKEVQVLDDTAPVYATLQPWQYHGSVYGVIAAKRGYLKPIGDWNQEEIYVKGDYFKVTLNGTVITEGDVKKLSAKSTLDKKEHPGLQSHKGHIAFLGHGSTVRFRNIRVKEL